MFTNAGMVQFKNVFTGLEHRDYVRAATSQKCVRAGGKHNDLDNVGYTARHHTFFEMLGNFSFGDYFKELAIPLAWDLVTREYGLPADRLLVTVFHDDDAAASIWKKHAGLPDERIIRIPTSDNFWSMGPTGPCGPCSEIFYDHGPEIPGGPPGSPDEDGDRFIEIWNLVFMQFEQFEDGRREPLPKPSIDTGMGLERIGAVLQGKHDNYDTDLMRALIVASAQATGTEPDAPETRIHHRVIADHLRAVSFLIADGVLPSNEGRGYVLRRIMRRAMRHAHMLGTDAPVMHRLVPALVGQMGQAYPELGRAQPLIQETLETGGDAVPPDARPRPAPAGDRDRRAALGRAAAGRGGVPPLRHLRLPGRPDAGRAARGRPLGRHDGLRGGDGRAEGARPRRLEGLGRGGGREPSGSRSPTGTAGPSSSAMTPRTPRARSWRWSRAARKPSRAEGEVAIVLNQTPFYAEAGGQVGDQGVLRTPTGRARITDTRRKAGRLHVHFATVEEGRIERGQAARAGGRPCAAHGDPRQPLGDAPAARGAARASRRARRPARLAGRARPAALRLRAPEGDEPATRSPRSSAR